jgi:molybdopterin molybdotransferase
MIKVEDALKTILDNIRPMGLEAVDIPGSLGRVLGADIRAKRPNPAWDNSAMDGYALLATDTLGATADVPARLRIIYDLPAGSAPKGAVKKGTAVRIMTGAPVPEGATAVVMVEDTLRGEGGEVLVNREAREGDNIRKAGEDFKEGDVVLKKGALIRPAEVAMLATVGAGFVFVHKRPRVAVVSTGDELIDVNEDPGPGRIINSNGYAVSALVRECGGEPVDFGIARDTKESLSEKLRHAAEADCVISSGGVSVGDYDFVKDVLKDLGSQMVFWKVAMKPGKPLAFGMIKGRPAFGLPGNPISSMVAFEEFVRPALLRLAGHTAVQRAVWKARIKKDLKIRPGRRNFVRALLSYDRAHDAGFCVEPLGSQGSGIISTMVAANSFIIVPEDSEGYKKGDMVPVQPIDPQILLKESQ